MGWANPNYGYKIFFIRVVISIRVRVADIRILRGEGLVRVGFGILHVFTQNSF